MNRVHEDTTDEELLDDVPYLWESQGPAGVRRGARCIAELCWRWGHLPEEFWSELSYDERKHTVEEMAYEQAVATLAVEAEQRGLEHDLTIDDVSTDNLTV